MPSSSITASGSSPSARCCRSLIDKSQEFVTGEVKLKLYKGGVHIIGRDKPLLALRPGPRHLRGRRRRLRPPRRRRLHQAQRAAAAHAGPAQEEAGAVRDKRKRLAQTARSLPGRFLLDCVRRPRCGSRSSSPERLAQGNQGTTEALLPLVGRSWRWGCRRHILMRLALNTPTPSPPHKGEGERAGIVFVIF